MIYVFRNVERRPSRDTGEVHEYITQIRRGRERPVAVSDCERDRALFSALAHNGQPEPRPAGLKVFRWRRPRGLRGLIARAYVRRAC